MKKNFVYAMLSAIALTGAVGITSCSSDKDVAEQNPGFNEQTGDVPVNFVFNVSTNSQGSTRMTGGTAQIGTGTFRGMQGALLMAYKLSSDGKTVASSTTTEKVRDFDLDMLISAHGLNESGKPDSRRVIELSLPTGANTLMFWSKALKDDTDAAQGYIDFSPKTSIADAEFTLKPCVPDDASSTGKTALLQYEKLIETVLNKIVQASGTVNVTNGTKTVNKTMAWSDYVTFGNDGTLTAKENDPATYDANATTNPSMSALGRILADLFVQWNTFSSDELRNGQGKMIAVLMNDIYAALKRVKSAVPANVEEKAAQAVAEIIEDKISDFFDTSNNCSWKAVATVISKSGLGDSDVNKINTSANLQKFPEGIFHLPPGATVLKYIAVKEDETNAGTYNIINEYHYMSSVPTYAMPTAGDSFNPFNYMYPAELCYFGNSPIRVTDDGHEVDDYPDGVTNWNDDAKWAAGATGTGSKAWTKNGHVVSSTRSVAMQQNINYGTALLKTTVKYGAATLKDNRHGLFPSEDANEITVTGESFELTGILVGGQIRKVGWDYLAKEGAFENMVYDNQIVDKTIPNYTSSGAANNPNYTLVWDNWNASLANSNQNVVYIALEFENKSGRDFWGRNNVIRNGSTFYLIGKLDPDVTSPANLEALSKTAEQFKNDKSLGITWPSNYALPPYNEDGTTIQKRRVFIQDFVTTANFTIGENSLASALVSVPDLRSTQISLGLSVDLQWSNGLTFDDIILGN